MEHEYVDILEKVGAEVKTVKPGDFVGSFVISNNTREICRAGFQSMRVHAEFVAHVMGPTNGRG
jgi:D-arabinose 1-dehydrogenase-like Zn-dependent alcohol dehydrogenase